jgi:predicted nuclease of predicted toxin-antitoxin system
MKLKLDENLSRHLKPTLSAHHHDVMTAADEGLLSQPDPVVAAAAKSEGRMLFTLDVEFGDEPFAGCVVVVEPTRIRIRHP